MLMNENFPIFPAGAGTAYTVRHDNRRYIICHIRLEETALHPLVLAEGASFESRHAAVGTAQQQARHDRSRCAA